MIVALRIGHRTTAGASSCGTSCAATWDAGPALLMPVFVLAGIYLGWFSPTEAGGFACLYAIMVGRYVYRTMTWRDVLDCAVALGDADGADPGDRGDRGAVLLDPDHQRRAAGDHRLASTALELAPWAFLMAVNIILLIVGCFLDPTSAILVLTPLFMPDRQVARHRPDPLRHRDDRQPRDRHVHAAVRAEHLRRAVRARRLPLDTLYRGVLPFVVVQIAGAAHHHLLARRCR